MRIRLPHALFLVYSGLFAVLAVAPHDRTVWWAENIPILLIVALLAATYRSFPFSNMGYVMMSCLVYLHTVGGHFTFELVPFDFVTDLFGFERNHYDRISHFSAGFYAWPAAELLLRRKWVTSRWVLFLFPIFFIFTVASVYEIIEWLFAVLSDPDAGAAFLGSQGDAWDAQKDMLADGLGAFFAVFLFWVLNRDARRDIRGTSGDICRKMWPLPTEKAGGGGARGEPLVSSLGETETISCPYGDVRRIVTGGEGGVANVHVVRVTRGDTHIHAGYDEVYYLLAGTGSVTLGDATHPVGPGSVVVVPAGLAHSITSDSEAPLEFVIYGTPPVPLEDPRAKPRKE
jgi:putative membrane protein